MPTWPSIEAFQREVETLDRKMNGELSRATRDMAERAEKIAVEEARGDLGGDSAFSGWDDGSRDLANLQIKKLGNRPAHLVYPTRKSGGPWKVAEQGRNQGDVRGRGGAQIFIGPSIDQKSGETFRTKTGKVRLTRRRRKGHWNGYTSGKRTASRAAKRFDKEAEEIGEKSFRTALSKHFDVT